MIYKHNLPPIYSSKCVEFSTNLAIDVCNKCIYQSARYEYQRTQRNQQTLESDVVILPIMTHLLRINTHTHTHDNPQSTQTHRKLLMSHVLLPEPATIERGRTLSRISLAKGANFRGRKSNSLMNLCGKNSNCNFLSPLPTLSLSLYLFLSCAIQFTGVAVLTLLPPNTQTKQSPSNKTCVVAHFWK